MTNERLNEIIARIIIVLKAIVLNDDLEVNINDHKPSDYIDRLNEIGSGYTEPPKWEKWVIVLIVVVLFILISVFLSSVNFK